MPTRHGDPANITVGDLKAAAKTKEGPGSVQAVLRNLRKAKKKK